jgi:hypothetical protein
MIARQFGILPPAEPEPEGEGWSQPTNWIVVAPLLSFFPVTLLTV